MFVFFIKNEKQSDFAPLSVTAIKSTLPALPFYYLFFLGKKTASTF